MTWRRVLWIFFVTVVILTTALLPRSVPAQESTPPRSPGTGQNPPRGNFVSPDLSIRTHPFVENKRYGSNFVSGRLIQKVTGGWKIEVYRNQTRTLSIPESHVILDISKRREGQRVLLSQIGPDQFIVRGLDRRYQYLTLLSTILLLCMLVGGWKTTRSLLAVILGVGFFMTWTVPQIQSGSNILFEICVFYSVVCLMVLPSVLGWNRRALSALVTAFITGILALVILTPLAHWLDVKGIWSHSFQVLDYGARYFPKSIQPINFRNLIIGATLVGALGVILDVCVDVTASAAEIARQRPDLGLGELIKRTITVSSRLVGTMTNTLLLAYIGTNLVMLIALYLLPSSWWIIINRDLVAVEVLRALGGALAFLSAVPLSILFYGLWFRRDKPEPPEDSEQSSDQSLDLPT